MNVIYKMLLYARICGKNLLVIAINSYCIYKINNSDMRDHKFIPNRIEKYAQKDGSVL